MIHPTASFKENLNLLPSVETLARIELIGADGDIVASIENISGKQGALVVYQYLYQEFGEINAKAALHGLEVFAEHTADAKARPGAHPNIDELFGIIDGARALKVRLVSA